MTTVLITSVLFLVGIVAALIYALRKILHETVELRSAVRAVKELQESANKVTETVAATAAAATTGIVRTATFPINLAQTIATTAIRKIGAML